MVNFLAERRVRGLIGPHPGLRRYCLGLLFLGVLCLVATHTAPLYAAGKPTLYVFLHTELTASRLHVELLSRLKEVDVTVFGRYRDLEKAVKSNTPDAVLALAPVNEQLGLTRGIIGISQGADTEQYVLIGPNKSPSPEDASRMTIGAVDILGRRGMSKWVAALTGTKTTKKIIRVARSQDLLPLLSLGVSDLLLIREKLSKEIMKVSELTLHLTVLPTTVGLPQLARGGGAEFKTVANKFKRLDSKINRLLGVSKWR